MKTKLVILFLLLSLSSKAQDYNPYKPKKYENLKTNLMFVGAIALNAVGDGLNDSNHKVGGHICNALSIGTMLSMPFILAVNKKKWWVYGLKYSFIRFGTFGSIYNGTRGLPINYIGTSSLDDKLYKATKQQPMLFEKVVFIVAGLTIPID